MRIKQISVHITPNYDSVRGNYLKVRVDVFGSKVYGFDKFLDDDDFNSLFERIMDEAKKQIKEVVEKDK